MSKSRIAQRSPAAEYFAVVTVASWPSKNPEAVPARVMSTGNLSREVVSVQTGAAQSQQESQEISSFCCPQLAAHDQNAGKHDVCKGS